MRTVFLMTNFHVIEGETQISVSLSPEETITGTQDLQTSPHHRRQQVQ